MISLFNRLGGAPAVDQAVDIFYRKVLADDRVNHFFTNVSMDRQSAMQKTFLTMAFGGPNDYGGRDLRTSHRHLVRRGLDDVHVDTIIEHLGSTLRELGAEESAIAEAAAIANRVRDEVLNR